MDFRLIFFVFVLIGTGLFLWWYRRRHHHPRFRPPLGEMLLVAMLCLGLGGSGAWFLGDLMMEPEQYNEIQDLASMPAGVPANDVSFVGSAASGRRMNAKERAEHEERTGKKTGTSLGSGPRLGDDGLGSGL